VERGVVGPRLEHPVIELEPVHLGANHVPVHLFIHGPPARVDGVESTTIGGQLALLGSHGGRRVLRHAVHPRRLLERAPVIEQRHEIGELATALTDRLSLPAAAAPGDQNNSSDQAGTPGEHMSDGHRSPLPTRDHSTVGISWPYAYAWTSSALSAAASNRKY